MKSLVIRVEKEDSEDAVMNAKTNMKTMLFVKKHWNLGPEKASDEPSSNSDYWQKMAEVWNVDEDTARLRLCANCEYFDNTVDRMLDVNAKIPRNKFDTDAGGRGWCVEFDFVCHNLRTCQKWEPKEFESEED